MRSRRFRLPLAVILILVTQVALAGQACRAVMPVSSSADVGAAMHQMAAEQVSERATAGDVTASADAIAVCCQVNAPPDTTCLVPTDAATSAAVVASPELPYIDGPVLAATRVSHPAAASAAQPARSAAGPPLRTYIVYHRFLS